MNRVLIDLGVVQIYWYSVCILVGMMIGMFLVYRETIKKGLSDNLITNLIFYTIIVSVIGARLYYVIFDWSSYAKNPIEILEIWNGGLAIHGAIIFGGLFLIYYTKQHKMDTLKILDICSVGLIIGQAIGRWGNFFNQEVFGGEVGISFLKGLHLPNFIIEGMFIGGKYHHPLFLYESLWCILGFIILLLIRRRKYIKTGQIFGIYCMWYSIGRFFLEGMREPEYNLTIGSYKIAQIVSIIMFFVGGFFVIRRIKTSRFEYLYNDDGIRTETNEETDTVKPFYGARINLSTTNSAQNNSNVSQETVQDTTPQIFATGPVETQSVEKEQNQIQQVVATTPDFVQAEPVPTVPQQINQEEPVPLQQTNGPVLNNELDNIVSNEPIVNQNNTNEQ